MYQLLTHLTLQMMKDDIIEIYSDKEVKMTKNDLTTFLRKEGHKHYRNMNDYYLNVFLLIMLSILHFPSTQEIHQSLHQCDITRFAYYALTKEPDK